MNNHQIAEQIYTHLGKINLFNKEECVAEIAILLTSLGVKVATSNETAASTKSTPTAEERLLGIIKLCTIKKSDKYPDSIFYMNGDMIVLEQDNKNKIFWCSSRNLWAILESEYSLRYNAIERLVVSTLEEHFKIEGFTTPRKKFPNKRVGRTF